MFSRDINILIWETYNYSSNFGDTWSAFTQNPLLNLRTLQGKRVCFREIVFPLLPRMIFGLYYNTPVIWGCLESGLFHAFSQFILHRLKIAKPLPVDGLRKKINVTLLSRKTPYRRILNEEELLKKLSSTSSYNVRKVLFINLNISYNCKISHSYLLIVEIILYEFGSSCEILRNFFMHLWDLLGFFKFLFI